MIEKKKYIKYKPDANIAEWYHKNRSIALNNALNTDIDWFTDQSAVPIILDYIKKHNIEIDVYFGEKIGRYNVNFDQ